MVLLDTARLLLKARVTMEEMVFRLQPHGRVLNANDLDFHARSWDINLHTA